MTCLPIGSFSMKRPRIEDIDATAAVDPTWAQMPRIQKPPKLADAPTTAVEPLVPYGSSPRRVMTRHPFEIYMDQLEQLRRFAERDKQNGHSGSMSEMVRGALDRLIAERKEKEGSE